MYEIVYTNLEGDEINFSSRPPFVVRKKTGFGSVENAITTEKQYGLDGEILVSERLEARDLSIAGTVLGESPQDAAEQRHELIRVLNPKTPGKLTFRQYNREYEIDVLISKAPEMDDPVKNLTEEFTCSFLALDPYWMDISYYSSLIPLAQAKKSHFWPLSITKDYSFAELKSGEIKPVPNDGDVSVGATFLFTLSAEVANPEVYSVLTQEYFRFKGTYPAGTRFRVVTVRGKKEAVMTSPDGEETNAMPLRDPGSTFLQLAKGQNYFQAKATSNIGNLIIHLDFQPLVGGV